MIIAKYISNYYYLKLSANIYIYKKKIRQFIIIQADFFIILHVKFYKDIK